MVPKAMWFPFQGFDADRPPFRIPILLAVLFFLLACLGPESLEAAKLGSLEAGKLARPGSSQLPSFPVSQSPSFSTGVVEDMTHLAELGDRTTGSPGGEKAEGYILESFRNAGLTEVGAQEFLVPIPKVLSASMQVAGETVPLYPWEANMVYLSRTPEEGLKGSLVYVGDGTWSQLNGRSLKDKIVLMDLRSRNRWLNAAMLEAKALVYLGQEGSLRRELEEKYTPTPLAFPRFWVTPEIGRKLKKLALDGQPPVVVRSKTRWVHKMARNCYGLIEGKSPELKEEMLVIEAFYDASSHMLGKAPGADEATSVTMLLHLARELVRNPPDRSVFLIATAGNDQGLAGMRQFVWGIRNRSIWMRRQERDLRNRRERVMHQYDLLQRGDPFQLEKPEDRRLIWNIISEEAKDRADYLTRETQYQRALEGARSEAGGAASRTMKEIEDPRPYRRLAWRKSMDELDESQRDLARKLLREVPAELRAKADELEDRRHVVRSSKEVRSVLAYYTPVLYLSLNLSTRAPFCGLVEWGGTFPLRDRAIKKIRSFRLGEILTEISQEVSEEKGLPNIVSEPAKLTGGTSGGTVNLDTLSSDISAMADLPAVGLATLDSDRALWGTPHDTLKQVDLRQLKRLAEFLPPLMRKLAGHERLEGACEVAGFRGMASMEGQAKFVRQGELFADQPAPGTIISVIQGDTVFKSMVYRDGTFYIPMLPNRRISIQKFILEPYGLDPETGRVAWTADKVQTGKDNYRIKVKSKLASTALTMFHCRQTDIIGAFHPQKLTYLTKVKLLDALTGAEPLRFWYSRIDGRDTMAISIFLEKGTRFKLILSETLLKKDFFLINSSKERPEGKGFLIGEPSNIPMVPHQVATDLRFLMGKRLGNLHKHGIVNRYLENLYDSSEESVKEARASLESFRYDRFWENVVSAWGKLNVIYNELESTQRDVLTGVMFFIALFVPFAFCIERYLFCFRSIYKQIAAFFIILILTILAIRALHPAFQLTYNPMVVIIAFLIVGLSVLVCWIIFTRFEREMEEMQSETQHVRSQQTGKWQAIGAAFSIGVSNLNRRKLRTALTCTTLIILTFTIMSFTNVKTLHQTTDTLIAEEAPYRGVMIRDPFWRTLTWLTLEDMRARYGESGVRLWPRAWLEPPEGASRVLARLYRMNDATPGQTHSPAESFPLEGVLGAGADPPPHFLKMLVHGRWFEPGERSGILVSVHAAKSVGLDPSKDAGASVRLWGEEFQVTGFFDGGLMEELKDLDQGSLAPSYMEIGQWKELTEIEVEAQQAGEQILPTSGRFQSARANGTVIIPYRTSVAHKAELRAVTLLPEEGQSPLELAESLSRWLSYPLFVGERGVWYHSASDTLRYQGVANLVIPILIVIFICLNTMIGHVHERRREIGIYTSVGLAPAHVGMLFIVEAISLAVMSTVAGYIVAQLSAKYLGNTVLFSELTFNYSSLSSIACMVLVFSVVFAASLYPARVAAEIAMPDVNRSWKLPESEGDLLTMNLPFLLKGEEEAGIMAFLTAFFESHQDIAHGAFIVDETTLDVDAPVLQPHLMPEPVCLLIRANVWLAPFDFGIKQRLHLHCCPSEDNAGYLEIGMEMMRLSGERSAWFRANKKFVQALRKQMLLWRLMDEESKKPYYQHVPEDYYESFGKPATA